MSAARPISAMVLGAGLLLSPLSFAALGGEAASVQSDQQQMKGMLRSTPMVQYEMHEIELPSGTLVREYIAAGKVFAVAWEGRVAPNLQQLLGDYYQSYVAGAKAQPGSHHRLVIQQPEFVMQVSRHPRSLYGRAYVPGNIPQGVSLADIR